MVNHIRFKKIKKKQARTNQKPAKMHCRFAGTSSGAAVKGVVQLKRYFKKNDVVAVLLHDSGSRYIGKIYNDDWMVKQGFKTE